jgi:predicted ATPase/DNA-binding SARP family transcriptional activator
VLGVPRLEQDGVPVSVQRRKVFALLIYLAVTGGSHTRDTLAALFWPDESQSQARAALRRALSELNKIMGGKVVKTDADSLVLIENLGFWLDVCEFHRHLENTRTHPHPKSSLCKACLTHLTEAIRLYRADFLTGFTLKDSARFDEWMCLETENLRRELTGALKQLVSSHQRRGEAEQAISYARRWLVIDSTDEEAHQVLMMLYAARGQRSAALRQYQECARILGFELGISPTEETTRLYHSIRSQADCSSTQSPIDSVYHITAFTQRATNLPAQVTSFIGRQVELEAVAKMLGQPEVRLITLTGPAGVGKTRLSLQIASRLQDIFRDGVAFIPLAPIIDPILVDSAIASGLGVRETSDRLIQDALMGFLYNKQLLLILDNFEHVLSASSQVSDLLMAAPLLKILVTSRAPLQVYGEHLFPVPPLSLPEAQPATINEDPLKFESVQLFFERARAVQPNFPLSQENATAAAEICLRLDGLPLAIELAAARTRLLTPQVMLAQFDSRSGKFPFHLFVGGPKDAPARHRTLHNAISWSFDLLESNEQLLFRRMAVFAGGCTLEAVERVCRDQGETHPSAPWERKRGLSGVDLEMVLDSLVDKCLVLRSGAVGESRFSMLEMIRAFALEQLELSGEREQLRKQHADHYLGLVEAASSVIHTLHGQGWRRRLERERDNFRAVLAWSLTAKDSGEIELCVKAVLKCLGDLQIPLSEQRQWVEKALLLLQSEPSKKREKSQRYLEADLWGAAGGIAYFQGDYSAAQIYYEHHLSYAKEVGDQLRISGTSIGLSWTVHAQGDLIRAKTLSEEALRLANEIESPNEIAHALNHLAYLESLQGDYAQSMELYAESLYFFRKAQDALWEAIVHFNMGEFEQRLENHARARELYHQGLALCWEISDPWGISSGLEKLARSAAAYNELIQATHLFAAAEKLLDSIGYAIEILERPGHEIYLNLVISGLDAQTLADAWAEGQEMTLEQVVAEALAF